MKRIFNLGSETLTPGGGPVPINLAPIPDKYMSDSYRVARLVFTVTFDVDVADQEDWTSWEIVDWLQNIYCRAAEHTLVNISGYDLTLFLLYTHLQSAGNNWLPATLNGILDDHIFSITYEIPFENAEGMSPQDYVLPAGLFNDAELIVTPGAAAPETGVTVNDATITVWAQVERKNEVQIASLPMIMALNNNLFCQLQPGVYTELFIRNTDKGAFVAADVTSVLLRANGETIHGAINLDGLLACYAWDHCFLNPYAAAGDTTVDTLVAIPIIWAAYNPASNRMSQFIDTGGTPLDVEMQGGEDNMQYIFRLYRPITAEGSAIQLGKLGAASPEMLQGKRKTLSKAPVSKSAVRMRNGLSILPVKVQGAQTQAALGNLASRFDPPEPGSNIVVRPR